jgi:hypothetical protein
MLGGLPRHLKHFVPIFVGPLQAPSFLNYQAEANFIPTSFHQSFKVKSAGPHFADLAGESGTDSILTARP